MNNYKTYMDRIHVSEEFHKTLLHLDEAPKKPVRWQKYTAAAACAALLIGAGTWGVARSRWKDLVDTFSPQSVNSAMPSAPVESQAAIEIAPVEGDGIEPGMKTIEGYEVHVNRAGMDLVEYHVLPWIDYGSANEAAAVALDWDIPQGAARQELSTQEIAAFLGGADAVDLHLDWSSYELTGWAAWYEDGSFWGAYLQGFKGPMDHFEFAVTAGQLPPTCVIFGGSVEQEVWGLTVTADKYDGEDGVSRRVSFMKDDYGYRFDLTATGSPEDAEKLVSRAVTWVANGAGLSFPIALLHGEVVFPSQEPGSPAGEPNRNDEMASPSSPPSQGGASAPSMPPAQ